jgi:hypothetical protein
MVLASRGLQDLNLRKIIDLRSNPKRHFSDTQAIRTNAWYKTGTKA